MILRVNTFLWLKRSFVFIQFRLSAINLFLLGFYFYDILKLSKIGFWSISTFWSLSPSIPKQEPENQNANRVVSLITKNYKSLLYLPNQILENQTVLWFSLIQNDLGCLFALFFRNLGFIQICGNGFSILKVCVFISPKLINFF